MADTITLTDEQAEGMDSELVNELQTARKTIVLIIGKHFFDEEKVKKVTDILYAPKDGEVPTFEFEAMADESGHVYYVEGTALSKLLKGKLVALDDGDERVFPAREFKTPERIPAINFRYDGYEVYIHHRGLNIGCQRHPWEVWKRRGEVIARAEDIWKTDYQFKALLRVLALKDVLLAQIPPVEWPKKRKRKP